MSKQVLVVLIDGFADWGLGTALPAARLWFGAEITIAGLTGRPVMSMGGFKVQPDRPLAEVSPLAADLWILPGSDLWMRGANAATIDALKLRGAAGKPIAACCGATLALAEAGLLDDRPHTSNGLEFLTRNVPAYRGQAYYRDCACVSDQGVITAGGSAPTTFAAEICRVLEPDLEAAIVDFQRDFAREHAPLHGTASA
jgi:putative intracellular protease/amidase